MAQSILEQLLAGSAGAAQLGGSPALQQPPAATPAWGGGPQTPSDPLAALLQGSVRYQQQHGQDPLAAAAGRGRLGNSGAFGSGQPVPEQVVDEQAQGLNRVAQVTSHGPRAGQAHNTFDLADGMKANVYFDAKGRRKVFVFAGEQPKSTG